MRLINTCWTHDGKQSLFLLSKIIASDFLSIKRYYTLFGIVRQRIESYLSFCGKQAENVFVHRRDKLVVVAGVIQ